MDILDALSRALDETGEIVAGVKPEQMDLPTPCTEWDVRTVIGHLVRGNENTAAAAEGQPRQPAPVAEVGEDPSAAYRASAEAVKRAWSDPSRLTALYPTPFGTLPGEVLLTLRLADNVTHGWDLARATGQAPDYDDDVVQIALTFVEERIASVRTPAAGGPFAAPVEAPAGAPAIDRVAAATGRDPAWQRPS